MITSHFQEFFYPKKSTIFLGKSKLNFWTKNEDFEQCAVSKGWKQFIDEDKSLANVQLTEAMSMYSKRKSIQGFTPFHFACQKGSDL